MAQSRRSGLEHQRGWFGRLWETIGRIHVLAWLWELFGSSWSAFVSAGMALGAGYRAFATQWGYLPIALTALGVFTAVIWGINGVIYLRIQRRPSKARVAFDYAFGLVLEEVECVTNLENLDFTFQVRLKIRNHSTGPLSFSVERFQTIIGDRVQMTPIIVKGVLSRMEAKTIFPGNGFNKEAFDSFQARTEGSLEYSIIYGHPEDEFSRRAIKKLNLEISKRPDGQGSFKTSIIWIVNSETDIAI